MTLPNPKKKKKRLIKQNYLALDEHVEEVIAGFLMISLTHQVSQIVMGDPQAWKVTNINPLVIKTAALRASNQIKQLLSLGGSGNCRIWEKREESSEGKHI